VSELDAARERWVALAREAGAARAEEPAWLAALRGEALARFADAGFPTTDEEEWRYTNVGAIARAPFVPASSGARVPRDELEEIAFPFFACSVACFLDGRFAPELSSRQPLSGALRVDALARAIREAPEQRGALGLLADPKQHPFAALNAALFEDGALVTVPAGAALDAPIHLVFATTGSAGEARASFPRVAIEAGAGSRALVVQDHVSLGAGARLAAAVTEVEVRENASLELVVVQRESDASFHVGNVQARLARDARLAVRTLTLGGALVRNDLGVVFAEPGAECSLDGLFLGAGERLVDNHTLVDHARPHCASRELYKGILGGRSRGVFRGRIVVRPDAQKTDARQANANVLLSDHAEIDTKPQLEIWADDVRCNHGASIGRLDEDALFYLRSRGIAEAAARDLLVRGFAAEVLGRIGNSALAEAAAELLVAGLAAEGAR
jgi:Fe-S cluster assembly protein SufD